MMSKRSRSNYLTAPDSPQRELAPLAQAEYSHSPVMLHEVLSALQVRSDGSYIDATFGRGGHAQAMLNQLGPQGKLLVLDKDPEAIHAANELFAGETRVSVCQGSFGDIAQLAAKKWNNGCAGQIDGILLDLGVSSPQLDAPERGFSFRLQGPLDMRMDTTQGQTAADWLNHASEQEIEQVLRIYGEERFSRRIARAIVTDREEAPFLKTTDLAELIARILPYRERKKHPATRSFQAIRIWINHEMEDLEACLMQSLTLLAPGGRLAVLSFHGGEARMFKTFARKAVAEGRCRWITQVGKPAAAELFRNVRARSAILRVIERS